MADELHDLEALHHRTYDVQVFRRGPGEIVARGTVRDVKPPGLYVEHDPLPLTMHDMTIDLEIAFPSLEVTGVGVRFGSFPQSNCPQIAAHYEELIGLSIARGFTHRVRELFGGPRGCTHVTALLQAMAPAVVQSTWSMRILDDRDPNLEHAAPVPGTPPRRFEGNLGTCHVWAADGELVARLQAGERVGPGIPVHERLVELGSDPEDWWARHSS
jgi:Protein of unknown function (DUF2889)